MNSAPDSQIGTAVVKSAYNAITGAYTYPHNQRPHHAARFHDRTHEEVEDAVAQLDDRVARPAVLRGEQLGGDGEEHAPHDVVRQAVAAVPAEQRVGRARGRAREQERASENCAALVQ